MNRPPHDFIRIPLVELRSFAANCLKAAGLRPDHADQLGKLLSNSDLCGVRSHGTRQVGSYCPMLRDGLVNPDPELTAFKETANAILVSGDGGLIVIMDLGHFANPDEVRQSNDNMVRGVRETTKLVTGYPEATLPGTPEHRNEETHTKEGVPIGNEELEILRNVASEWDVALPEALCP